MLAHGFAGLGLHRIALSVFAFNERAVRAYRKAGFRLEGRLREAIWRDGRYWDELQMGILADEWRLSGATASQATEAAPHTLEAGAAAVIGSEP
jgi:RimJ/RimL family protein N-acetyltransferase